MITPEFSISQNISSISLNIKIKYIKISDIQIDIFQNQFKLYANPYFLRLNFPGNLTQDAQVEYDLSLGNLAVVIPKEIMEEFPDLEYTTKLLSKIKRSNEPLIQDITPNIVEAEDIDWEAPQIQKTLDILSKKYGFNYAYSGLECHLKSVAVDLLNISEIDSPLLDFAKELSESQDEKFDSEHYYADFIDGIPSEILDFKSEYAKSLYKFQKDGVCESLSLLDQQELSRLVWKEYLLTSPTEIYFGLVDLMFSYSYNYLINGGEDSVESAWNLVKVSPTLSAFVTFSSLESVLVSCFRSSLTYPLLRNWKFSELVLHHTTILFKLGKTTLLKCLLSIKRVLEADDRALALSQIWILDYIIWIQSSNPKTISSLASKLHHSKISKNQISWPLLIIENSQ